MSVTRIPNGGTVIVRTGVLQGVGPVGPTGPRGAQGPVGPQGEDGPIGPQGSVAEYLSEAVLSSSTAIGPNSSVQVPFAATVDELNLFASATNIIPNVGVYQVNLYVEFEKPASDADGSRGLQFVKRTSGVDTVLAAVSVPAVATAETFASLSCVFRFEEGFTYHVKASSTDDTSVAVSESRITINRIGPGVAGPVGPIGPTGPDGPAGPTGPKGDPGNATAGFNTFEDLRGE